MQIEKLAWHTYDLSTLMLLAILAVACICDIRSNRIPNKLVLAAISVALVMQAWFLGWTGFVTSLIGLLVGFFALLPFYLIKVHNRRLMGAGDVKLMAAIGTFLGPQNTLLATGLTLAAGTIAGLAYLFWHGVLAQYLQRYWSSLKILTVTGQCVYQAPDPDDVAMRRFPYSLAIAAGTIATLMYLHYLDFYNLRNLLQGLNP